MNRHRGLYSLLMKQTGNRNRMCRRMRIWNTAGPATCVLPGCFNTVIDSVPEIQLQ